MPERSTGCSTRDPFAITPDPGVYVPRASTETARHELLRSACNPEKTTALIGPPGLGKTLLLHVLAEEAPEDMQTVYLPYAALPPTEFCAWALGLLGSPAADDPIETLQALGRELRERGSSLLMLVDDAGAMPIATARWVGELVQNSGGSLRLAVAASDNATGNRVIAAIGSNFDIVHLNDPMTESETRKYIDARLALARAPDSIRARFEDRIVQRLHRLSAGIPRRLHSAAAEILQEAPVATAGDHAIAAPAPVDAPRQVSEATTEESVGPAAGEFVDSAGEEFVEPASIESEEANELPIPDSELPTAPALPRRAPPPSRGAIALCSLLVAFVAVAIPGIRSILSESRQIAVIEPQADPQKSTRGDFRESTQGDLRESAQGNFQKSKQADPREPSGAIEPGGSAAREAIGEIRAATRAVESPAEESPPVETFGPLAVQINASPWANIEVDGIDLGVTPLANIPLFAGAHSFRAKMPDGRVIERTVEIDAESRFISFE
jgi:type II secretory pathway predicted ATPase ExeA